MFDEKNSKAITTETQRRRVKNESKAYPRYRRYSAKFTEIFSAPLCLCGENFYTTLRNHLAPVRNTLSKSST